MKKHNAIGANSFYLSASGFGKGYNADGGECFDQDGNLISCDDSSSDNTSPSASTPVMTDLGNGLSEDSNGNIYDSLGNLTGFVAADGTQTVYNTDASGNILSYVETDPDGSVTTYSWSGIPMESGDTVNSDGSVDHPTGDNKTYVETEIDGTTTTYTNNGIPMAAGDTVVYDSQGNEMVHHDNGNGTYTETEADGTTTTYNNDGSVVTPAQPKAAQTKSNPSGAPNSPASSKNAQVASTASQKSQNLLSALANQATGATVPAAQAQQLQAQVAKLQSQLNAANSASNSWALPVIIAGVAILTVFVIVTLRKKK